MTSGLGGFECECLINVPCCCQRKSLIHLFIQWKRLRCYGSWPIIVPEKTYVWMKNALVIVRWLISKFPAKINAFAVLHLCQWDRQAVCHCIFQGRSLAKRLLHIPKTLSCWVRLGTWCPGTWPTHWLMLIQFHWPPTRQARVSSRGRG